MSITKSLFGTNRVIPQTPERNWGAQVTSILSDLIDGVDKTTLLQAAVGLLKMASTDTALAAAATLTVTHPWHRVNGSGGAVALDGTTAIGDGFENGQLLVLTGTDAVNTVEVPDGANTDLNGKIVLGLGDAIFLIWDNARSVWQELTRNN